MTAMRLRLLQYSVASHSRRGEVIKQQLVQTALQEGLCDVALVHGCTGIHEPLRSGTGAIYQAAGTPMLSSGSTHSQAGTMFCYTAHRFRVRQLSSTAEDLPGFVHSIVLVQEISTSTSFIGIVLASGACINSASDLAKLWHLMKELATQCPVLAAGDCRLSSAADRLCSDPSIQIQLCQPVQHVASISQSFFATACCTCSPHQIQIKDIESLLARPAAASAQYTQNAHTATCCITWDGIPAQGPAMESSTDEGNTSHQGADPSMAASGSSNVDAAAQLGVLVNAASMEVAETVSDVTEQGCAEDTPGLVKLERSLETVPLQLTASCATSCQSGRKSLVGKNVRKAPPAPLTISCQSGASEIEPKPPTPAHGKLAGRRQLTQTSSGNFCYAANTAERGSGKLQGLEEGCSAQPQTPAPFQLQPNPTGRQAVDINTLRIMQLQRSISELSASNLPLVSEDSSAAMASELNAMLSQQRLVEQAPQASADVTGRLSPEDDAAGMTKLYQEGEQGASEHVGRCSDIQGEGLYAAAKQAPGELKAAWHKHVQQPVGRKALHKQVKSRSREDKMSSPGRLLKCLQSRTDSDVEMQAMQFKH